MQATNIEIKENLISFDMKNDDGSSFTDEAGRPVTIEIPGWLNQMPVGFVSDDVQEFIDNEMIRQEASITSQRMAALEYNAKLESCALVAGGLPPVIRMTEASLVKNETSPGEYPQGASITIKGAITGAVSRSWSITDKKNTVFVGGVIDEDVFSIEQPLNVLGDFVISIVGTNKRGMVSDSVDIVVVEVKEPDEQYPA